MLSACTKVDEHNWNFLTDYEKEHFINLRKNLQKTKYSSPFDIETILENTFSLYQQPMRADEKSEAFLEALDDIRQKLTLKSNEYLDLQIQSKQPNSARNNNQKQNKNTSSHSQQDQHNFF